MSRTSKTVIASARPNTSDNGPGYPTLPDSLLHSMRALVSLLSGSIRQDSNSRSWNQACKYLHMCGSDMVQTTSLRFQDVMPFADVQARSFSTNQRYLRAPYLAAVPVLTTDFVVHTTGRFATSSMPRASIIFSTRELGPILPFEGSSPSWLPGQGGSTRLQGLSSLTNTVDLIIECSCRAVIAGIARACHCRDGSLVRPQDFQCAISDPSSVFGHHVIKVMVHEVLF